MGNFIKARAEAPALDYPEASILLAAARFRNQPTRNIRLSPEYPELGALSPVSGKPEDTRVRSPPPYPGLSPQTRELHVRHALLEYFPPKRTQV